MQFHIPFLNMCKDAGWETAVAARNDYSNPEDCAIPFCDSYFDIPFERSPLKPGNVRAYRELKKVIYEGNYDIIHCHTPVGAMLARLAARKARKKGTKVIYTAHGFHFFKGAPLLNWLVYYPVERFLARWTDVLITINREDYAHAQKFRAKAVTYIPGVGIDIDKFAAPVTDEKRHELRAEMGVPDDAVLIISVGELVKNKNHSIVIRALAQLENKSLHYCIVGEGEYREKLIKLSRELGVSERVHLLGYRRDIPELNKASDVFCFPSLREGLSVALMEAMASGLPCVASRIRGNVDLLSDSELLFPVEDLNALCDVLHKAADPEVSRSEVLRNAETLKKFSLKTAIEAMKDIYVDAISADSLER